jgi:hypothetical protein
LPLTFADLPAKLGDLASSQLVDDLPESFVVIDGLSHLLFVLGTEVESTGPAIEVDTEEIAFV